MAGGRAGSGRNPRASIPLIRDASHQHSLRAVLHITCLLCSLRGLGRNEKLRGPETYSTGTHAHTKHTKDTDTRYVPVPSLPPPLPPPVRPSDTSRQSGPTASAIVASRIPAPGRNGA